MKIPEEAQCRKEQLHDFIVSKDLPDALIEVCRFCGERAVYYKREGRYDAQKHLRAHLRDTLQPYGQTRKLFQQVYGTKGVEKAERMGQKFIDRNKRKEERLELHERRVAARKRMFGGQGKSIKEIEEELKRFKYKTTGLQNV